MGLIDTHCHLDASAFNPDFAAVIQRALAANVEALVAVGVSPDDWSLQLERARQAQALGVRAGVALGIHPWWVERIDIDRAVAELDRWLQDPAAHGCPPQRLVAIGEIGLDFADGMPDPDAQMRLFEAQLTLAQDHRLPVILHAHKSEDRLLWYLRRRTGLRGAVHGFTGSLQQARAFADLGFMLGIGGAITHPGAHRMHRLVRALPPESMLLETDAPNQPGHAHRGERNEPAWLGENLEALAALRDEAVEQIAQTARDNALALFGTRWLDDDRSAAGSAGQSTQDG